MRPQSVAGKFERCDRLLAADSGKVQQEIVEPVAGLKVVDERLHRHPSANEHGRAAQDLGVDVNNRRHRCHGITSAVILHQAVDFFHVWLTLTAQNPRWARVWKKSAPSPTPTAGLMV